MAALFIAYLVGTFMPVFGRPVDACMKWTQGMNPVVAAIENRFIARGIITGVECSSKGMQKFAMQVKKTEPFGDYPNFGGNYQGKEVEIFSEIGIPHSFQAGVEVSVLLRVSGDEWGQYLFLVEVIEDGAKN